MVAAAADHNSAIGTVRDGQGPAGSMRLWL